jgi:hypothetical protein
MINQWIALAGIGAVVGFAALLFRWSRIAFTIVIRDGELIVKRGNPPEGFVIDVRRIADFSGITSGTIHGHRGAKRTVTLRFRGIKRDNQWQFINAWRNPI